MMGHRTTGSGTGRRRRSTARAEADRRMRTTVHWRGIRRLHPVHVHHGNALLVLGRRRYVDGRRQRRPQFSLMHYGGRRRSARRWMIGRSILVHYRIHFAYSVCSGVLLHAEAATMVCCAIRLPLFGFFGCTRVLSTISWSTFRYAHL